MTDTCGRLPVLHKETFDKNSTLIFRALENEPLTSDLFSLRWTTWTVMSSCPTWHPCLTPFIAPRDSFKNVLLFLPVLSALPKEEPVPEVVLLVSVSAVSVSHLVILAFSLPIQWMIVFVWAVRNSEKLVTWIFSTNFYVRLPFSLLYHGWYLPIFFVRYFSRLQ